jgi:amidohydrolase
MAFTADSYLSDGLFDRMVKHRRFLHQNPEVSFKEFKTTEYIVDHLQSLGYTIERPLETGCVAILGDPSHSAIALRADIDALPMDEEGDHKRAFLSTIPGAAHCCGHDVHTANLLGVAEVLASQVKSHSKRFVLIFQPAEEKLPGGGNLLTQTGIFERLGVEAIYGLHTYPGLPAGQIAVKSGPLMASTNEVEIRIYGRGGHAAAPHETIDPIVIAAEIIGQLQTIVSRMVRPTEPAVVSITSIHAGSAYNVIPEQVDIKGTVRGFSLDTLKAIEARMRAIVEGVASAMGGKGELFFNYGYPAVINHEATTAHLTEVATSLLGESAVHQLTDPIMAGEDFAFYQQRVPGTFFFLGSGGESTGSVWPWHHPKYNADENCMKTGVRLMVELALA